MKSPHFWSAGLDPYSRESAPLTRALLTPLAALYARVSARRMAQAKPEDAAIPVICIGNVTTGGSGKTPIVQALRSLLIAKGIKAASLSRGHGGKLKGPTKVDPQAHTARDVGDEPLMLAATGPTWISRDRRAGAVTIAETSTQAILMDDGHQNQTLRKDLSIIVVDADAPFGNGYVIPKGPLREPVSAALQRADAVILMGTGATPKIIAASGLPVFRAALAHQDALPSGPLIAFAGIGRPTRFFESIRDGGGDLKDYLSFADHHTYSPKELTRLRAMATEQGATLITTEKDYARIPAPERFGLAPIRVHAIFKDEAALLSLILPVCEMSVA